MICDKKCIGCGICTKVCQKNAIRMVQDKYGFYYPQVDEELCVNCGLCEIKCPINSFKRTNFQYPETYMCWSNDEKIVKESSSGGIFTEISKYVLKHNGCVVACEMNADFECKHIIVKTEKDLMKVRGSKYTQSSMVEVVDKVKEKLDKKQIVLFCGCPCQVAALKKFVGKEYENLYTADLICHGVSSNEFFKKYISELEKKYNKKIIEYKFRSNKKEFRKYVVKYVFEGGKKKYKLAINDSYMACYLKCAIYREACYDCQFNGFPRVGDITLGDYSGVSKNEVPKYAIKNGISCCLINNEKGQTLFNEIKSNIFFEKKDIEKMLKTNRNIINSSIRPSYRDDILNYKDNIEVAQRKFCKYKLSSRIVNKLLSVDFQNRIREVLNKK